MTSKICVFGAGAIGSWLGSRFAGADADVTLVARGAHLEAIQKRGLEVCVQGSCDRVDMRAIGTFDTAEPQDVIVVTLKSPAVRQAAQHLASLCHSQTVIVWAMNGIPWWYFFRCPGEIQNIRIDCLDPDGCIGKVLNADQIIGCVVYPTAELVRPGTVRHLSGNRLVIGELDESRSQRLEALQELLDQAGCQAEIDQAIRTRIWMKLWGNSAFNPLSVLAGSTLGELASDIGCRAVATAMMKETKRVAASYGAHFNIGLDERIEEARKVGAHRTSMLQDFEAGKPLETDSILDAVLELAQKKDLSMPMTEQIRDLLNLKILIRNQQWRTKSGFGTPNKQCV